MVGLSLFSVWFFLDIPVRIWGLFFPSFSSSPGKIKTDMLELPKSLGKKSTGKISDSSAELLAVVLLRKSLSHLMAGVFVSVALGKLSVLDSQANRPRSGQAVHANLSR